ncbi:MAG TPA: recombinase family protein [Ruminococcus sp.]
MERKRLTATGTTKWTCHNVGRILQNATYRGYIGYNKSYSNNYLEQKRIHNLNKDSYEYVKDDFEPIITEEQWDRCQDILKEKRNFGYFNDFLRF